MKEDNKISKIFLDIVKNKFNKNKETITIL